MAKEDSTNESRLDDQTVAEWLSTEISEETVHEIQEFIRRVVDDAGADGVVVNLSGGIDSTVSAMLATEALGSESVDGLILPADANSDQNIIDARHVAEELAIDHREINIQPLLDTVTMTVTGDFAEEKHHPLENPKGVGSLHEGRDGLGEAIGNAAARLRMLIAYFEANMTSKLVLGTGNRTELLLGYFTKYGDGGVDLLPIGDLYKTDVREVARHLDVRDAIIEKEPTAGLWEGQSDEAELGASYETIDAILCALFDQGHDVTDTAQILDVSPELVRTYADMCRSAAHKRNSPPTPVSYPIGDNSP